MIFFFSSVIGGGIDYALEKFTTIKSLVYIIIGRLSNLFARRLNNHNVFLQVSSAAAN